jgi:signal transduction histidine kinase
MISHEFRTPLTLIINPIKGMLQHKPLSKEAHELSTAYRNARRMLSLVDQLVTFQES